MNRAEYDSLTPMERNCLRLARHDCKTEQIAHELGIAASTVNTHIFAGRRKLSGVSRLNAADQLRSFEIALSVTQATQALATEPFVTAESEPATARTMHPPSLSRSSVGMAVLPELEAVVAPHTEVREEKATFVFDDGVLKPGVQDRNDAPLQRIVLILAIAVLTALVLISAPAIYDSAAERVANSLERPHDR